MITNLHRNCVGTINFDARFPGMRKWQDFIVYPMRAGDARITIQSDTRIGHVDLATGVVTLCPPQAGGAFNPHLSLAKPIVTLGGEALLALKAALTASARPRAGNVVHTDNAGAAEVLTITRGAA